MKNKVLVISVLLAGVMTFFASGLDQYLTFEALQHSRDQFVQLNNESPWQMMGVFFLLYILVTGLSLPGAVVMTLAAGAMFGLITATILVSFASSIGATLAFLLSRFLLRDIVQNRFSDQLKSINQGIDKDGAYYLFTLRLVPIFPFVLINLLMGLTSVRTLTFYWVSQLGMLAGTVVYVNAGTHLAQIDSLSGILSPEILLSFAVLGIFPLLARTVVRYMQQRRVYARWSRPKRFDRNLVVIGGGAAGLVSAYIAATVKAKVTLIEAHKMGGDCLNYGCVPSKALIRSAKLAHQIRHADRFGLQEVSAADHSQKLRFNFKAVIQRVHEVIRAIEPHDSVERYTRLGVDVLQGYARVVDPWRVEVTLHDGAVQLLSTRSIIIATGAKPFVPPISGLEEVGYLTSDTLWDQLSECDEAPRRLVVLGGGPIGCELSQAFARLGSQVTQVEMAPRMMMREDEDVSEFTRTLLEKDGVRVLTGHQAIRCEQTKSREEVEKALIVQADGQETRIQFDVLICAVGRVPRLSGYGLEELGIPTQRTVVTNEYLETLYPNIYAAGDVAGPYQFTHTAAHMAWYAAVNALFGSVKRFRIDYSVVPWTTFVDPEIARVGLNELEAREENIAYEVTRYELDDLDRAITDGEAQGFVKVLTIPGKDRILGVTIVGVHAAEMLAEYVLAMKHGLGLNKILAAIHIYPSFSEANKYAAGEWKRMHSSSQLLQWIERFHDWRR